MARRAPQMVRSQTEGNARILTPALAGANGESFPVSKQPLSLSDDQMSALLAASAPVSYIE
jgi:hypothetical protein